MIFYAIILLLFLNCNNLYAEREKVPREKRGVGLYYRQALANIESDGVKYNGVKVNLITFDLFAYDLTERKFIAGLQIHYGIKDPFAEIYGFDIYAGRRFTILPYILHGQFKAGPSIMHVNYDLTYREIWTGNLGAFSSVALQFTPFSGTSFLLEWETRGISPASLSHGGNIKGYRFKFNNSVPKALRDFSIKMPIVSNSVRVGVQFYF